MNKLILFILIISFWSCNDSSAEKTTKANKVKSKLERDYEMADMLLQFDAEKIGLLSILKDVPQEKANAILRDYLAKTFDFSALLSNEDPNYIVKVVDTIARKNNLSKKLTASIIFSYQYEMVTKDEIIENAVDEKQQYEHEPEQY